MAPIQLSRPSRAELSALADLCDKAYRAYETPPPLGDPITIRALLVGRDRYHKETRTAQIERSWRAITKHTAFRRLLCDANFSIAFEALRERRQNYVPDLVLFLGIVLFYLLTSDARARGVGIATDRKKWLRARSAAKRLLALRRDGIRLPDWSENQALEKALIGIVAHADAQPSLPRRVRHDNTLSTRLFVTGLARSFQTHFQNRFISIIKHLVGMEMVDPGANPRTIERAATQGAREALQRSRNRVA